MQRFSLHRLWAVAWKEFVQMRRDRLTFAMIIGIPLIQLLVFGFAINADPKNLPTAVLTKEASPFTRSVLAALTATKYFTIVAEAEDEADAGRMLLSGEVMFVVQFPTDFSKRLVRGERPAVLLQADASDPIASSNALAAVTQIAASSVERDLRGPLKALLPGQPPFDLRVQRSFNPEGLSDWNIVPGLLGVVLTMTMVIITALAITREYERGTMENLLATPARPLEVMVGKILPYIVVGYIQAALILCAARFVFGIPFQGSVPLLLLVSLIFIAANLSLGLLFSTLARSQLQAVQMAFFFFLPSILLSGFMFPFRGMPLWAQYLGSVLPLTHYLRIVRGILLKGAAGTDVLPHVWPLAVFACVVMAIGVNGYRRTLD